MRHAIPLLLLLSLLAAGCVRRTLIVESTPPEAEVWIDGERVGLTPVREPFSHYGTREIVVVKGGYTLAREKRPVEAPWYERFPLDFFTENLWPGTLVDERRFAYVLQPSTPGGDDVYARGKALRDAVAAPPAP